MTPEQAQAFATSLDRSARIVLRDSTGPAMAIGPLVLLPRAWLLTGDPRPTIVHECCHVRQYRWCGLGIHPWVGLPLFLVLYGLVLFPLGLAWARYRLELAACAAVWRWQAQQPEWLDGRMLIDSVTPADRVASKAYFFAVPHCWARWGFQRKLGKVLAGG